MNLQGFYKNVHQRKSQWLPVVIFLLVVLITEPFYRDPLYNASVIFEEHIQGPKPTQNYLLYLAEFVSIFGNSGAFIVIVLLVYNYANIFKTYVLLMDLLVSVMMISLLKMIYTNPRPYWDSDLIQPFGCEGGWGNPSGHSLATTSFYLSLWHIVFENQKIRSKKKEKIISLILTICTILLIMFSRVCVGMHSINQVIFGSLLGLGLYFLIFYVICVEVNDSDQLAKFLGFKNLTYGLINVFLFIFAFLIFFFYNKEDDWQHYNAIIDQKCPWIKKNKRMQNEGFVNFCIFLANCGAFIGIKFEYYFVFNENSVKWKKYNFELDEHFDQETLLSRETISKETQWNHTNSFFSLIRLLIIAVMSVIIFIPHILIDWDSSILMILLMKILVPFNLVTFSIFYVFKVILKSFHVTNNTVFTFYDDNL